MANVKKDYMDILLEAVHRKFNQYLINLKEMIVAEQEGLEAYPKTYLRQIAPAIHHYYVLMDDTYEEAMKTVGLKKRHRDMYCEISQLDREMERLAVKLGFKMGMLDAMKS